MMNFTKKQEIDEAIEQCAVQTSDELWRQFDPGDTYQDEGYFEPFKLWHPYVHPLNPQWRIFFCLEIHHMERHDQRQDQRMIVQRVVNQSAGKWAKGIVDWGTLDELAFNWHDAGLQKRVVANFRLMLEETTNIYYDETDEWSDDNWDQPLPPVRLGVETFDHEQQTDED